MIVGIPIEVKNNESRVGMTPAGVLELTHKGHTVYVQSGAAIGSGFTDEVDEKYGAQILDTIEEVYEPYLIQEGYLQRTAQGRIATARAYQKFGLNPPNRD